MSSPTTSRVSLKAYARHRGCDPKAVRKALDRQQITRGADGLIDVAAADAAWPLDGAAGHPGAGEDQEGGPGGPEGGTAGGDHAAAPSDYYANRARKEGALADLRELEVMQKRGELVSTLDVQSQWFTTLRLLRNRLLNLPDRLSDELAAETDSTATHALLTRAIREALTEVADEIAVPVLVETAD